MQYISKAASKGCNEAFRTKRQHFRMLSVSRHEVQQYYLLDDESRRNRLQKYVSESESFLNEYADNSINDLHEAKSFLTLRHDIEELSKIQLNKPSTISDNLSRIDSKASQSLSNFYKHTNLRLRNLAYESSNISALEAVVKREKVLSSLTLSNLKGRLSHGRFLYGLFHKDIPDDPLVFVHVALTDEFTSKMSSIDENPGESDPQYAIFYSITSSYSALKNIGLPQLLLQQTKTHLQSTVPTIHTYSTLSPIPGFIRWLTSSQSVRGIILPKVIDKAIIDALGGEVSSKSTDRSSIKILIDFITTQPMFTSDPILAAKMQLPLQWLCAHYLSQETKTMSNGKVIPLDEVANFHLRNGASLFRINYAGDMSPAALQRSAGMMVNYLYASTIHMSLLQVPGFQMPVGQSVLDMYRV